VLQEPIDELRRWKGAALDLATPVVTVVKANGPIVEVLETAVGDGNAEDVAGEVVEDLLSVASVSEVDHPVLVLLPDGVGYRAEEALLLESVTDLGAEDDAEGVAWDEEAGVFGGQPPPVVGQAAGGHEEVSVGVEQHCARPGVKDGDHARTPTKEFGVGGELGKGGSASGHQDRVDDLGVGSSEWTELCGESEGQEEVRHGEQTRTLGVEPAPRLLPLALRTVTVAAGMVAIALGLAAVASREVSAEGGGATLLDVPHGIALIARQTSSVGLPIRRPGLAENLRDLEHGRVAGGFTGRPSTG
jgi:hypothetical protein